MPQFSKTTADWRTIPEIAEWATTDITRDNTRQSYIRQLLEYWSNALRAKYPTLLDWKDAVEREQRSRHKNIRTSWAIDLKQYMNTYVSPRTGKPLSSGSKGVLVSAVISFLKHYLDAAAVAYDFKIESTETEVEAKQKEKAPSKEEVLALYNAATTTRDRAVILILVNGAGWAEFNQVATKWKDWFSRDMKAPVVVPVFRQKSKGKRTHYHITLWDECVEKLKELYNERVLETGPDLRWLFVNNNAKDKDHKYTYENLEEMISSLRNRTGLRTPGKYATQHIRSHAFRKYFKTQAKLHEVSYEVTEYCMGHVIKGSYQYDLTPNEPKWIEIVNKELGKMLDVLDITTGKAQVRFKEKEEELLAKGAKRMYTQLFQLGALKPETLTPKTIETIAKAIGIRLEDFILATNPSTDWNDSQAYFDGLARAIDLPDDVTEKYLRALRVLKPTNAKAAWENTDWYWLRVEVGSDEYMQALADHFELVDKDDKMRILRKPIREGVQVPPIKGA
jgi:hypothetical protein